MGQTSLLMERDLILARTFHHREDGANMTIDSLSNHDGDGDKNVTNLHI